MTVIDNHIATGKDILTPDVQASVIAVINVVLRLLTKDGVAWKQV